MRVLVSFIGFNNLYWFYCCQNTDLDDEIPKQLAAVFICFACFAVMFNVQWKIEYNLILFKIKLLLCYFDRLTPWLLAPLKPAVLKYSKIETFLSFLTSLPLVDSLEKWPVTVTTGRFTGMMHQQADKPLCKTFSWNLWNKSPENCSLLFSLRGHNNTATRSEFRRLSWLQHLLGLHSCSATLGSDLCRGCSSVASSLGPSAAVLQLCVSAEALG